MPGVGEEARSWRVGCVDLVPHTFDLQGSGGTCACPGVWDLEEQPLSLYQEIQTSFASSGPFEEGMSPPSTSLASRAVASISRRRLRLPVILAGSSQVSGRSGAAYLPCSHSPGIPISSALNLRGIKSFLQEGWTWINRASLWGNRAGLPTSFMPPFA